MAYKPHRLEPNYPGPEVVTSLSPAPPVVVEAADRRGNDWVPDSKIAKGKRAAVAVADIGSLEEQTDSATRTVLLIGFLAALAFAVAFYAVGGPKSG